MHHNFTVKQFFLGIPFGRTVVSYDAVSAGGGPSHVSQIFITAGPASSISAVGTTSQIIPMLLQDGTTALASEGPNFPTPQIPAPSVAEDFFTAGAGEEDVEV